MPMHANVENILELFYSDSCVFDKEGRLYVNWLDCKQSSKVDYRECFCRLRGNLLFIAQIGPLETANELDIRLLVLRNFEIKLCEDSKQYEFCINITQKTNKRVDKHYFTSNTRNERDKWIESIYLASFKFLSSFCKALNDELAKKEAILKDDTTVDKQIKNEANSGSISESFITIQCENLSFSSYNPNIFVKVYCRNIYIDKNWKYLGSTEIIQSKNPHFIRCIKLCPRQLSALVEVKFELYNVVELQNQISFLITVAYFRIDQPYFTNARSFNYLKTNLRCISSNQFVGTLQFNILNAKAGNLKNSRCSSFEDLSVTKSLSSRRISSPAIMNCLKQNEPIQFENFDLFCKPVFRQFSFKIFETNSNLLVEETMSESKFVFLIPQILMKLYAKDEEKLKFLIEQFYQDNPLLPKNYYEKLFSFHLKLLNLTKESLNDIINFMSRNSFRPSKNKKEIFLQFIPVNFHKQSCRVFNESRCETLDVFTVGAYACHHLGYDKCGMRSMLDNLDRDVINTWTTLNKLIKVLRCESKISTLLEEASSNLSDFEAIESAYKSVCTLSDNLIDLISVEEVERWTSHLSDLCNGQINMFDDDFEPVELVYLNIKACLVTINYKLKHKQLAHNEIGSCNRKLNSALQSLRKILLSCYIGVFSQVSNEQIDILFKLRFRHLSLYTQALTTLVVFIMDQIIDPKTFLEQVIRTRSILVCHETLLSCYSDELGMLDDMTYALEEVSKYVIVFFKFEQNSPQTLMPDIDTLGDKISFTFHLKSLPDQPSEVNLECKIVSLIFNLGINEQATLADKLGYRSYQNNLNEINYTKLKSYLACHFQNIYHLSSMMEQLRLEMAKPISKNIEILNLTEQIVSSINGIRVTCCKSAKDRTGMSITLEETRFCFKVLNLSQNRSVQLFQTILDTLRRDGTRIENAFKNIGFRKYAFNYLQLLTFPSKMKPPPNTYSTLNIET